MIHLCLVSAQPIPNLAPALDPQFKPERVFLAVSPEMQRQADAQESVFRRFQIPVERLMLGDAWDLPSLLDTFCTFLDAHAADDIALNATGGTKPMAIAAQEAFRMAGRQVFYVHEKRDELVWLDSCRPAVPIVPRLKLEPFLQAHGFTVQSAQTTTAAPWHTLAAELVSLAGKGDNAIAVLNAVAKLAETGHNDRAQLQAEATGTFDRILEQLYKAGCVSYYDDREVTFSSPAARKFANGGWLETYAHDIIATLSASLQDYATNLVVLAPNGSKNEIDVAFLYRNRLILVECKTRRYNDQSTPDAVAALYKLDSLTFLGGLRTRGILVSCFPAPDFIRKRATTLGITIWHGGDLSRLGDCLKTFLRSLDA